MSRDSLKLHVSQSHQGLVKELIFHSSFLLKSALFIGLFIFLGIYFLIPVFSPAGLNFEQIRVIKFVIGFTYFFIFLHYFRKSIWFSKTQIQINEKEIHFIFGQKIESYPISNILKVIVSKNFLFAPIFRERNYVWFFCHVYDGRFLRLRIIAVRDSGDETESLVKKLSTYLGIEKIEKI